MIDNIKKILATVGVVGGWLYLACFKPVYMLIIAAVLTIVILIADNKK
jgi:hypothetical protein